MAAADESARSGAAFWEAFSLLLGAPLLAADPSPNGGRRGDTTRQAYTGGVLTLIDGIAARMAPHDPLSVRVQALSLLAMMAGTLQLSRALADRRLADALLAQGIDNALALLGTAEQVS